MNIRYFFTGLLFALAISVTANAQFNPYSLGLRFSGGSGTGAELSYQSMLGDDTRLQADFGLSSSTHWSAFSINLGHQWLFPIASTDGLIWYAGANAQLGSWGYKDDPKDDDNGVYIGIGGTIGIEYTLPKAPIQFAIDTRPMINFINPIYNDSFNMGGSLAVRYRF